MKEAKTALRAKINIDGEEQEVLIMPITRLDCIEDTADVMEKAAKDDCIPIMDSSDDGQMKKISIEQLFSPDSPAGSAAKAAEIASEAKSTAETAKNTADEAKAAAEEATTAVGEIVTQITEGGGIPASTLGGKSADEFAAANHTHTAADISGLPSSLPANGGNADTVGGAAVMTTAELGLHRMASGADAANSTNCPPGCWYGQYE